MDSVVVVEVTEVLGSMGVVVEETGTSVVVTLNFPTYFGVTFFHILHPFLVPCGLNVPLGLPTILPVTLEVAWVVVDGASVGFSVVVVVFGMIVE